MVATTNAVAKIAAVAAGLSLVFMSFASFAAPAKAASIDDLQAQINALLAQIASLQGGSSASASMTFTMDQTIGSTGAEVTALQNWLISKGYSIPAGATGYFGAQTQAALAAYQAANGISPAAGFFGPITRAKVNAAAGGSTSTGGTTTGGLSGGEADLRNFDLSSGDDIREGDSNKEFAIAKFDVKNGDARLQRVTVEFTPTVTSGSPNQHPWTFIDTLSVYDGNTKIGSADAGSKNDWTKEDDDSDHTGSLDYYTMDIPVNDVVKEGDMAELSLRADAQSSIDTGDTDQVFAVDIDDNGIRAVDSQGIQEYTGDTSDTVNVGFNSAEDGDLTVKKASDTPVAGTLVADDTDTSDDFDVLKFQLKNTDDADADLTDLTVTVATSTGNGGTAHDITDIIRRATLSVNGDDFDGDVNADNTIDFNNIDETIAGNDTTDLTLSVQLFGQTGHFAATGEAMTFTVSAGNVTAEGSDTGDASSVSGTATGFQQSIAVNGGITVEGNSMNSVLTYNSTTPASSYGTFTVKFDVTAVGDDVYVPKAIQSIASTTVPGTATGVVIQTDMIGSTTSSTVTSSLTTTADSDNATYYVVHDGDTETFTATVTIDPTATADFQVGLDKVRFSSTDLDTTHIQTIDVDQTDSDFHTDPLHIPNS